MRACVRACVRARAHHCACFQAASDLHAIDAQATRLAADGGGGGEGDDADEAAGSEGQTVRGRYPRMPISKFGDRLTTGPSFAERMQALGAADGMRYPTGQCRVFEWYLAALFRRRIRTRAAIKRKQRLEQGLLDEEDEDEDEDEDLSGEPEDQLQLLRPADAHNNDKPGRIRALWEPTGDFEATNYVNRLTAAQLEEMLVDLLLVGQLFKFRHQRTPLKLPSKDRDDDDIAAATATTPVAQAQAAHGEFFERQQLEDLIAKLLHERHLAAIRLQRHLRRGCVQGFDDPDGGEKQTKGRYRALLLEFELQDYAAVLYQALIRRHDQASPLSLWKHLRQVAFAQVPRCASLETDMPSQRGAGYKGARRAVEAAARGARHGAGRRSPVP